MDIIDFWKQEVSARRNSSQYDSNEFLQRLEEVVPDWKEQVKNKSIWPDLHSHGNNINESCYTKVIIEEAGLEYAFYLIDKQWGKLHLDACCALDYCVRHLHSNWHNYPDFVKEKILNFELREFLDECSTNPNLWNSLTLDQKNSVLYNVTKEEKDFVSDWLLFKIWSEELNYKKSPFIVFFTDHFKHIANEIIRRQPDNQLNNEYQQMIERRIHNWATPTLANLFEMHIDYNPSERLNLLQSVVTSAEDKEAISFINKSIIAITNILNW